MPSDMSQSQSQSQSQSESNYGDCTARLRALHNVAGAPAVNVYLNDQLIIRNLSYTQLTAYASVPAGKSRVTVKLAGTDTVILSAQVRLKADRDYTAIVAGLLSDLSTIQLLAYRDNLCCPKPGSADVRFIHAAAGAPAVDVYVNETTRVFADVSYTETGDPTYLNTGLGWVDVSVTVAGTQDVVVGPVSVYLESGGIYTIIASGLVGDDEFPLTAVLSRDNPDQCEELEENFDIPRYMGKWYQIASIPQFFGSQCANQTAEYTLLHSGEVTVFNTCFDSSGAIIETITGTATVVDFCQPAALRVEFPIPTPTPTRAVAKMEPSIMSEFSIRTDALQIESKAASAKASEPAASEPESAKVDDVSESEEMEVEAEQDDIPRPPPGANYLVHRTNYDQYAVVGSPGRESLFFLARRPKISRSSYDKLVRYAESLGYDTSRLVIDQGAVVDY